MLENLIPWWLTGLSRRTYLAPGQLVRPPGDPQPRCYSSLRRVQWRDAKVLSFDVHGVAIPIPTTGQDIDVL